MSSSSTPSTHKWKYDVFVSCHEDILKSYMSHLFSDFKRKGIHCFRDGKEDISSIKAIEVSRFLVIIFSKNYASSTNCLNEVLRIIQLKTMEKEKYEIRTVFYDVKPAVVRYQLDSYKEAFKVYEQSFMKEVPDWRKALADSADFSGKSLQSEPNGHESTLINIISMNIFEALCHGPLDVAENLVGLHCWAEKMELYQIFQSSEVHMIGICGIAGVGKTTVARAIYNKLYMHFDGCSFCEDVSGFEKRYGLPHMQKQLINNITKRDLKIRGVYQGISEIKKQLRSKRVLIFLDNVDHRRQLEALAGKDDWFCPGSLIIMTSKDRQLLNAHQVKKIYEINCLKNDEAVELFSLHAFKQKYAKKEFRNLSHAVVQYAEGHPFALEELGRFLFSKEVCEWECELKKLQKFPHAEIQKKLRTSYECLDMIQQKIFLDIACFFRGEDIDFVTRIVDGCHLFSDTNIRALVDKLLITISADKKLQMLGLIQRMGIEIVREKCREPALRSRLFIPDDVCDVLNNDKGTDAIEGIVIDLSSSRLYIGSSTFTKMNILRILKLYYGCQNVSGVHIEQNSMVREDSKTNYSGSPEYLSNELRLLCWHGYPFAFLPSTFFPESLVSLDMSYSRIKELWTGTKSLDNLIHMKLSHCRNLTTTVDFTKIPVLKELDLEGCTNLVEVHTSVGILKRLTVLNLKNCKNLLQMPSVVELDSLQTLILSGCSKLDNLPEELYRVKTLMELHVDGTALYELPSSTMFLTNLRELSLGRCAGIPFNLWSFNLWPLSMLRITQRPMALVVPSLSSLQMLKTVDVSHCNLPNPHLNDIAQLSLLEDLNLSGTDIAMLPTNFGQLSHLRRLGLVGCKYLQALLQLPSSIELVDAMNCVSLKEVRKPLTRNKSTDLFFALANCTKLLEYQKFEGLFSMLLPQGNFNSYGNLSMLLPGNVVPKFFSCQNKGNCVRVELPPLWSSSKLNGFAIASVLSPKTKSSYKGKEIGIRCHMRSSDCISPTVFDIKSKIFSNEIRYTQSDQTWFSICTSNTILVETKEFIELSFETCGIDDEVMQCGVCLLHDEDEGESSSEMFQWLASAAGNGSV